jgi:transcriptional regulator with XRE-family HTH domain
VDKNDHTINRRASDAARTFGSLIRSRRQALDMSQDQLALATGVGRRFLIHLEAGKTSCHLGRSLVVAEALGLRPADMVRAATASPSMAILDLPDVPQEGGPNG